MPEAGGVLDPDASFSQPLLAHLKALELVRKGAWEQLKGAYEPGTTAVPHKFQVGDSVLVRRHRSGNLEPRWKGPYLVLLTSPTAIKVDGIPGWIHASHIKAAPPATQDVSWKLERTGDPLKLHLCRLLTTED